MNLVDVTAQSRQDMLMGEQLCGYFCSRLDSLPSPSSPCALLPRRERTKWKAARSLTHSPTLLFTQTLNESGNGATPTAGFR
jgi:hypothetical protein